MQVKGPIGAVIATLYSGGWEPEQPGKWKDPEGQQWEIDYLNPDLVGDIEETFEEHYEKQIWKKAAKHHCGSGLQHGADLTVVKKHLRAWRKRGSTARQLSLSQSFRERLGPAAGRKRQATSTMTCAPAAKTRPKPASTSTGLANALKACPAQKFRARTG